MNRPDDDSERSSLFRGVVGLPRGRPGQWSQVVKYQFCYSLVGLAGGLMIAAGGAVLLAMGVGGRTHWVASVLDVKSELNDAAPGVVFVVVGLLVIIATRFTVKGGGR